MEELRVGGVPEHFNIPWRLAIEGKEFEKENTSIHWTDYPGGTGAMTKDLRSGALDVAVLLTEGIIADIAKGNESRIIAEYVSSPLIWGIHVSAQSSFTHIDQIKDQRYAISRLGSGSHLMAYVNANQRGWKINEDQFVIVGDMTGAREAFKKNEAEIFMWEKFMTQPLVDAGEFRRIGECPTPWPCFVIAARNEVIEAKPEALRSMLSVIEKSCADFQINKSAVSIVQERFNLKPEQAAEWFSKTAWSANRPFAKDDFDKTVRALKQLNLISETIPVERAIHRL